LSVSGSSGSVAARDLLVVDQTVAVAIAGRRKQIPVP
jgi:hypothetical protein